MFMPELQAPTRAIDGSMDADLMIIGGTPNVESIKQHKPFAGPVEGVLQDAIHQAGMIRAETCISNLIFDDTNLPKYWREKGAKGPSQLKANIDGYKEDLWNLIKQVKPKVIVTLGELPCFALLGRSQLSPSRVNPAIRGYPFKLGDSGIWVIPSLAPKDMIWANNIWRNYLAHDLVKARKIVTGEITPWPEFEIVIPEGLSASLAWITELEKYPRLAWDIEVSNFHTSCMGFSYKAGHGVSFPTDMRWTDEEELQLWRAFARLLENPDIEKIGQNIIFDCQFVAAELGIFVQNYTDIYTGHSIMYPDFYKSLNFFGSIYTSYPFWKDELKEKSIKVDN